MTKTLQRPPLLKLLKEQSQSPKCKIFLRGSVSRLKSEDSLGTVLGLETSPYSLLFSLPVPFRVDILCVWGNTVALGYYDHIENMSWVCQRHSNNNRFF